MVPPAKASVGTLRTGSWYWRGETCFYDQAARRCFRCICPSDSRCRGGSESRKVHQGLAFLSCRAGCRDRRKLQPRAKYLRRAQCYRRQRVQTWKFRIDLFPLSMMMGTPARQVGWVSAFGEKIDLPLFGAGEWRCKHTNEVYVLNGSELVRHPGPQDILKYVPERTAGKNEGLVRAHGRRSRAKFVPLKTEIIKEAMAFAASVAPASWCRIVINLQNSQRLPSASDLTG